SGPDAALVSGAIPMVATVLGIKYGGEAIVSKKIAGAFLGLICVSSYLLYQYDIHLTTHVAGNLLVFGNVLCFCLAMLIIKTKLHGLKAVEITSVMLVLGGSIMALAGTDFTPIWRYCLSSKSGFFQILFEVFMTTALGYALNLWTLQKLSLANATVFNYLQLPLTACFGAMMFNGPVSWALAAALVGTGLSCLLVVTAKG
ncbi:MAG: EamA family transporter, partial [Proteobacteria bacterium]|nr:EamA family transporter [Pseudomonadota bacterium]